MDDVWIYGGDATSIFETISQGRPNGMPAFGNRIPKRRSGRSRVRSLDGGPRTADAAPNRDDAS
jgi:cytochrome c oxidase cbb3-type subunit 3